MFKLEVEQDNGIWVDVFGDDGKLLTFDTEQAARDGLRALFPVLVEMEKYGQGKRTRVIRIWSKEEDEDWNRH